MTIEDIIEKINIEFMKQSIEEQKFIISDEILTLDALVKIPCGEIFKMGEFLDSDKSAQNNIALCAPISYRSVRWIAVKGRCEEMADWCIYCENPWYQGEQYEFRDLYDIKRRGDKICNPYNIRKLVPCDDEAFLRYRY